MDDGSLYNRGSVIGRAQFSTYQLELLKQVLGIVLAGSRIFCAIFEAEEFFGQTDEYDGTVLLN